jgi:hypothetical protein
MAKQFLCLLMIISLLSCHIKQKFDKEKWAKIGDLMTFPNRKYMIDDLTSNYLLKGKNYNEILKLLGQPQGKGDNALQIFYDIDIDYGSDIDPIYTKTLLFQLDKDSVVESFKIKEWKKQ